MSENHTSIGWISPAIFASPTLLSLYGLKSSLIFIGLLFEGFVPKKAFGTVCDKNIRELVTQMIHKILTGSLGRGDPLAFGTTAPYQIIQDQPELCRYGVVWLALGMVAVGLKDDAFAFNLAAACA